MYHAKPIETIYKGYRFRSRLEARWAVVFDGLNIEYQYEPEGFVLEDGEKYLPDFYIVTLDCYFEVKGLLPTEDEIRKASKLAESTGKFVYLAFGEIPYLEEWSFNPDSMYMFYPDGAMDNQYYFCECPQCGAIGIEYNGRSDRLVCKNNGCQKSAHGDKGYNYETDRLNKAYLKGRQARFEHGEAAS